MPINTFSIVNRPTVINPAEEGEFPVVYMGEWDADANDLGLIGGVGTKGVTYKVSVAGNTELDGNSVWSVGDYVSFNGETWDRLAGGSLTITSEDISDATAAGLAMLTATDAAAQEALLVDVIKKNVTAELSIGFTHDVHDLGTMTDFTANPALEGLQHGINNGGFTITAPASDGGLIILVTNGASAGTIVFSGFTAPSGGGGDDYATTNTLKFLLIIARINGVSTYWWKALQ